MVLVVSIDKHETRGLRIYTTDFGDFKILTVTALGADGRDDFYVTFYGVNGQGVPIEFVGNY